MPRTAGRYFILQDKGVCMIDRILHSLILSLFLAGHSACGQPDESLWRLAFNSDWLGPVEAHFDVTLDGDTLVAVSRSGAVSALQSLPGDHDLSAGLVAFTAKQGEEGTFHGSFTAPWKEGVVSIRLEGDQASGKVEGGAFNGEISGKRVETAGRLRDYPRILQVFDEVVAAKVFEPAKLDDPSYIEFRRRLGDIAELAKDDLDLLFGFHWLWTNDPFSHFELKRSAQSAEELFAFFDNYRVGFEAASLRFDDDVAILKVATMTGADTIEQIEAAYDEIEAAGAQALIIDLRGNGGGAFAVKPLVGHVIDEPLDAGFFLSQRWSARYDRPPTADQVLAREPWQGWSILAFWHDVQEQGLLRLRFQPAEPHFDGEVYVLLDGRSASATELAADALRTAGATLVGQATAGEMLSQSFFDVAEEFTVSLPVADYYSLQHGRIEGVGVPVDIEADDAMDAARNAIATRSVVSYLGQR